LRGFFVFSKVHQPIDDVFSADTSDAGHWKVTLAKAARLLSELATTLKELEAADPTYQYTQAANSNDL